MYIFRFPLLFLITFILVTTSRAQDRRVIVWGHPEDRGRKFKIDSVQESSASDRTSSWYKQYDTTIYQGVGISGYDHKLVKGEIDSLEATLAEIGLYLFDQDDPYVKPEPNLAVLGLQFCGRRKDLEQFILVKLYTR